MPLFRKALSLVLEEMMPLKGQREFNGSVYEDLLNAKLDEVSANESRHDFFDRDFRSALSFCEDYFDCADHLFDSVWKRSWEEADALIGKIIETYSKGEPLCDPDLLEELSQGEQYHLNLITACPQSGIPRSRY